MAKKKEAKKTAKKKPAREPKKPGEKKPPRKSAVAQKKEAERVYMKGELFMAEGLPANITEEVEKVSSEMKLRETEKEKLVEQITKQFEHVKVESGEAVGIVTAQSLGEPGTQLTLRTKHYAGSAEVSVGSGIQRVEEIVDGRSKAKYPTMTIYIADEKLKGEEKKLDLFAKTLIDVRIDDVISVQEDLAKGKVSIAIDKEAVDLRNVNIEELTDKINKHMKKEGRQKDKYSLDFTFRNEPLLKIRKTLNKLRNTRIQGVRGIEKVIVTKENNEPVIKTRGTNLKAIIKMDEIDGTRTTTNDIKELSKVLGIEAGRISIVNELHGVLKENGISVDIRHIMLLADSMTWDGDIKGIVRTGITRGKSSPFARAAFEETVKHLLEASFKGETENLEGVVENIIVGQPIKVGTGRVSLVVRK